MKKTIAFISATNLMKTIFINLLGDRIAIKKLLINL